MLRQRQWVELDWCLSSLLKSQGLGPLNNLMPSTNAMRGAHFITLNGRKAFSSLAWNTAEPPTPRGSFQYFFQQLAHTSKPPADTAFLQPILKAAKSSP